MDDCLHLHLAKCHHPVRGLGWGRRTGIWFQGCSIRCRGCVVPETWEATPGHRVPLAALLHRLLPWLDDCDGVTISGGEPFDQPEALAALLAALRTLCHGDLLVYSGYPWATLQSRYRDVLAHADVIVSEPFVQVQRTALPVLAGSRNQRVHLLTPLASTRYADWPALPRDISITQNGNTLDLAGLLAPGELPALANALRAQGWQTELSHAAI
jgi:anaerobic ribonucleoside-triphosphate reductase activating protein